MKYFLFFIIFFICHLNADIIIRPATMRELEVILTLDRQVTYDFFYPLYSNILNHFHLNIDLEQEIEKELLSDAKNFSENIKALGNGRLHVAWDDILNIPCGFITFHKTDDEINTIILDVLLVDAAYRNKKIGKKLVYSALNAFDAIEACIVYPFQHYNDDTLNFYKALGFNNVGVGPSDKYSNFGVSHADLYYCLKFDLKNHIIHS